MVRLKGFVPRQFALKLEENTVPEPILLVGPWAWIIRALNGSHVIHKAASYDSGCLLLIAREVRWD